MQKEEGGGGNLEVTNCGVSVTRFYLIRTHTLPLTDSELKPRVREREQGFSDQPDNDRPTEKKREPEKGFWEEQKTRTLKNRHFQNGQFRASAFVFLRFDHTPKIPFHYGFYSGL